ncbi:hypothetical protein [Streptomyces sp. BE308]|nr:hypothetical protein [Streptomyces sp. BE308]
MDANLVRLPPDAEVGEHQEDVLDGTSAGAASGAATVRSPGR